MSFKKALKGLLIFAGIVFIALNIIICFQAYRFTHFAPTGAGLDEGRKLDATAKMDMILFGVKNARPQNTETPSQHYSTGHIKSNVTLEAWSIKTDSLSKGTVILFHGYRASKSKMIAQSDELLKLGYNTLLVDFMGSGGSGGNSTTIGFEEAQEVRDCYNFVRNGGEKKIYLMGTSMGAVSIMKAMADYHLQPAGLILECPFGTMYKTVCARFDLMGLPRVPFAGMLMFWGGLENGFWAFSHNPVDYAKSITCPTLLLWGEADNRVSRAEIDDIYSNLRGKKSLETYPLSGHVNYLNLYRNKWVGDVGRFLNLR